MKLEWALIILAIVVGVTILKLDMSLDDFDEEEEADEDIFDEDENDSKFYNLEEEDDFDIPDSDFDEGYDEDIFEDDEEII